VGHIGKLPHTGPTMKRRISTKSPTAASAQGRRSQYEQKIADRSISIRSSIEASRQTSVNGLESQPAFGFSSASVKFLVNTETSVLTKDPHRLCHFCLTVWSHSQIKRTSDYFHLIPELKVENYIMDNIVYSLFHHHHIKKTHR
jgi:hypothetical protein